MGFTTKNLVVTSQSTVISWGQSQGRIRPSNTLSRGSAQIFICRLPPSPFVNPRMSFLAMGLASKTSLKMARGEKCRLSLFFSFIVLILKLHFLYEYIFQWIKKKEKSTKTPNREVQMNFSFKDSSLKIRILYYEFSAHLEK